METYFLRVFVQLQTLQSVLQRELVLSWRVLSTSGLISDKLHVSNM